MNYSFIRIYIIFSIIITQQLFCQDIGSKWINVEALNDEEIKDNIFQTVSKTEFDYPKDKIEKALQALTETQIELDIKYKDDENNLSAELVEKTDNKINLTIEYNNLNDELSQHKAERDAMTRNINVLDSSLVVSNRFIEDEKDRVQKLLNDIPFYEVLIAKVGAIDRNKKPELYDNTMDHKISEKAIDKKIGQKIIKQTIIEDYVLKEELIITSLSGKVNFNGKSETRVVQSKHSRYRYGLAKVYPFQKQDDDYFDSEKQSQIKVSKIEIVKEWDTGLAGELTTGENKSSQAKNDLKRFILEKEVENKASEIDIKRHTNSLKSFINTERKKIIQNKDEISKIKKELKENNRINSLQEKIKILGKTLDSVINEYELTLSIHNKHVKSESHIEYFYDEMKQGEKSIGETYAEIALNTYNEFKTSVKSKHINEKTTLYGDSYEEKKESRKTDVILRRYKILGQFYESAQNKTRLSIYMVYDFGFKFEEPSISKEESEKQASYQKLKYNLIVTSNPRGATVSEAYKNIGITPLEIYLKAGDYDLIIKKAGYRDKIESINVSEYQLTSKHIRLIKDSSKMTESSKKKEKPSSKQDLSEKDSAEKNYLIGAGISFGLPALINLNARIATKSLNFEYATDIYSLSTDSLSESEGIVLGRQFSVGFGDHTAALNYIWGHTEFYGIEAYPALYGAENNVYEYQGVTLKGFQKYYFWEIGANWGDKQFYGGKAQFYFQLGTMLNIKF